MTKRDILLRLIIVDYPCDSAARNRCEPITITTGFNNNIKYGISPITI
jgi:hypothetical protein